MWFVLLQLFSTVLEGLWGAVWSEGPGGMGQAF
jgi:hypothetical protein